MKSPRRAAALLILCLLPAAVSAAEIPLNTSGWSYFIPRHGVALLPGGGFAAAWNWAVIGGPNTDWDVRTQWIRPDGSRAFPKGYREVAASPQAQEYEAVIAPHPRSGAFVAFGAGDSEVKTEVFVQRFDGAGKRLWRVAAAVEEGRRIQGRPSLVPDAEGGVYVCLMSFPADGVVRSSKILCQHLDASGRRRWPKQGLLAGGTHGLRVGPLGLTDGRGGLLVFWRNERGTEPQLPALIEGQRFAPDGTRLWGRQGRLLHTAHEPGLGFLFPDQRLRAVSDGAGGAVLAFSDRLSESETGSDVVAQRVDGNGNRLWGAGVPVADEPGRQSVVDMVPAPGGGAFVLSRNEQGLVSLGLHLLGATGATLWQTQISSPEAHDALGYLAFDGDLLRVVWTRQSASASGGPSQLRMLVLDLNGNRLNGSEGEVLAESSFPGRLDGFVYDRDRGQGFAVWSFGESLEKSAGVLFNGQP